MLKRLIKGVLPEAFVRAALDARSAMRLAATPREGFDAKSLRCVGAVDLESAFHGGEAEATWRADHAAIEDVFRTAGTSGGINPGDRRAVYCLVRTFAPRNVLEVGTHVGASTLAIGRALTSNGMRGRVTTVDIVDVNRAGAPWQQAGLPMPPRDLAATLRCAESIRFEVAPALDYLRATDERFDFVFLDGDHGARAVYQEVAAALRVLDPGGVILLHDYYPGGRSLFPDGHVIRGPFRAMSRVQRDCPGIAVLPLGNLPWPTKQGLNVTSLALVTGRAH
jgi:predicted O-methyltransferase YrrM